MNRDQKAAVIDEVADRIQGSQAIFAIDYRGISVKQAVELRQTLSDADAHFQVVKNRLTIRSADKAGAEDLKAFLEGPTALAFVNGDAAVAAKALATFRRQNGLLEFKGGTLDGEVLSVDQIESIARLPARDMLHAQFVGVLASPITGLVRGLASMIGGLAQQLQQIADQGLVSGAEPEALAEEAPAEEPAAVEEPAAEEPAAEEAPAEEPAAEEPAAEEAPAEEAAPAEDVPAEGSPADGPAGAADAPAEEPAAGDAPSETTTAEAPAEETPAEEAPGSPVAEAETAEQEETSGGDAPDETTDAPSEGDAEQEG
jgi:large subunit ribosomal protein L10